MHAVVVRAVVRARVDVAEELAGAAGRRGALRAPQGHAGVVEDEHAAVAGERVTGEVESLEGPHRLEHAGREAAQAAVVDTQLAQARPVVRLVQRFARHDGRLEPAEGGRMQRQLVVAEVEVLELRQPGEGAPPHARQPVGAQLEPSQPGRRLQRRRRHPAQLVGAQVEVDERGPQQGRVEADEAVVTQDQRAEVREAAKEAARQPLEPVLRQVERRQLVEPRERPLRDPSERVGPHAERQHAHAPEPVGRQPPQQVLRQVELVPRAREGDEVGQRVEGEEGAAYGVSVAAARRRGGTDEQGGLQGRHQRRQRQEASRGGRPHSRRSLTRTAGASVMYRGFILSPASPHT